MLEVVQQTQESPSQWLWRVDPSARRGRAVSDTQGRERWWNSLGSDTRQRLRMSVTAMRRVQPTLPDAQKLVWWQKLTPDQRQFFRYKFGRTGDRDDLIDDVKKVFGIYKESGVAFGYVGGIADQFTAQAKNYATGQVDKYVSGAKNYATGQVDKYVSGAKDYATGQVNKYVSGAKDYATGQVNKYIPPGVSAEASKYIPSNMGASPDRILQELGAKAQKTIKEEVEKQAKQFGSQMLSATGAQGVITDVYKNMGLPSLPNLPSIPPIQLPTELTPKGVADAAYGTGRQMAENWIQKETGLSIQLPKKLTAKELERSVIGLLPKDMEDVIDLGLSIGSQYAAGAITSLIAGAAIGSVIPGLGTVVGIGVALGVSEAKKFAKGVYADSRMQHKKFIKCEGRMPYWRGSCPALPTNLPPIELIPWLTVESDKLLKSIAEEERVRGEDCLTGRPVECLTYYTRVYEQVFRLVKDTPAVLGRPQVERLILRYRGGVLADPSEIRNRYTLPYPRMGARAIYDALLARKTELDRIVNLGEKAATLPPKDVPTLRWVLLGEVKNAALQYQMSPTSENQQWLKSVSSYLQNLLKREQADAAAMKQRYESQKSMYADIQKDPQKKAEFDRSMLMTQCSDGYEPACVKLRQMGQTPGKAAAPAAAPAAKPAGGAMTQAQGEALANGLLDRWLRENPSKARCMTPAIRKRLIGLAVSAYVQKTVTVPYATGVINSTLASLCAQSATPPPARPPARPGAPTTPSQPFTPAPRPPATSPWASASNFNPWGRRP